MHKHAGPDNDKVKTDEYLRLDISEINFIARKCVCMIFQWR